LALFCLNTKSFQAGCNSPNAAFQVLSLPRYTGKAQDKTALIFSLKRSY